MNTLDSIDAGMVLLREREDNRFPITGSAIGKCSRELAMEACGRPKRPISPRALRIFAMGTATEETLVSARRAELAKRNDESGWTLHDYVTTQREIWTRLPISPGDFANMPAGDFHAVDSIRITPQGVFIRSRADLVIGLTDGTLELEEYKSIGSFQFKKLQTEGSSPQYVAQTSCQVKGLQEEGLTVSKASIVYMNKDDSDTLAIPLDITPTSEIWHALADRLDKVARALLAYAMGMPEVIPGEYADNFTPKTGKLPWQCDYCNIGPEAAGCLAHRTDVKLASQSKGDMVQWFARARA